MFFASPAVFESPLELFLGTVCACSSVGSHSLLYWHPAGVGSEGQWEETVCSVISWLNLHDSVGLCLGALAYKYFSVGTGVPPPFPLFISLKPGPCWLFPLKWNRKARKGQSSMKATGWLGCHSPLESRSRGGEGLGNFLMIGLPCCLPQLRGGVPRPPA